MPRHLLASALATGSDAPSTLSRQIQLWLILLGFSELSIVVFGIAQEPVGFWAVSRTCLELVKERRSCSQSSLVVL